MTASSQRRPSRAVNRSCETGAEFAGRLAFISAAERWLVVGGMTSVVRPLRAGEASCEVTVYVPAEGRRNSFDQLNYLLIKPRLRPEEPRNTTNIMQPGWAETLAAKFGRSGNLFPDFRSAKLCA